LEGDLPAYIEETKGRVVRGRDRGFAVVGLGQSQLHIRLPGAEPYLAHENVFQFDYVVPGNCENGWSCTRGHAIKLYTPFTFFIRSRLLDLTGKTDADAFIRICLAPDLHTAVALQDHSTTQDIRHLDIRVAKNCRHQGDSDHHSCRQPVGAFHGTHSLNGSPVWLP